MDSRTAFGRFSVDIGLSDHDGRIDLHRFKEGSPLSAKLEKKPRFPGGGVAHPSNQRWGWRGIADSDMHST